MKKLATLLILFLFFSCEKEGKAEPVEKLTEMMNYITK